MEGFVSTLVAAAEIRDPLMPLWAMELTARVLLYGWLFALGATVGSFLNVVVYRLPRGINLAIPGSFCPHCGHPIRLSDNVPILSWLALRARCRDCGGRIALRYFLVELLAATTFLAVLTGEHFLPTGVIGFVTRRPLTPYDGAAFWGMYGLHLVLLLTLYAAVLIAGDGFRVPRRLYGPVLVLGSVLPLIWPDVRSVPALSAWQMGWKAALVDGAIGLVVGLVVGAAFDALVRGRSRHVSGAWMISAIGIVFGWQRVLWIGPLAALVSGWATAGLREIPRAAIQAKPLATEPLAMPEIAARTGAVADPETISEEVHIVSPPTEPTEPS
jgi:leader peptidase (prepilin peptidase)/N-methyltransferase